MTIKQLLEMPIGQKTGGFLLTVKMAKKFWEVTNLGHKAKGRIFHQNAIVTDDTGQEMIATIMINSPDHGNHDSVKKGQIIRVVVCEIQNTYDKKGATPEPNKKLFIEQYTDFIELDAGKEVAWGPEGAEALAWAEARREEVKGKCRHGVICALIQAGQIKIERNIAKEMFCSDDGKRLINNIVDFIITGE